MGADKAVLDWNGKRAVDRLAELIASLGIETLVVSGADLGLPFVLDARAGAGPAGGILQGAAYLAALGCERALVLAVDAPTLTTDDVTRLMDQPAPGAAYRGFPLPMAVRMDALPEAAEAGWPLRRLAERAGLAELTPDGPQVLRLKGANTPDERQRLLDESKN